MSTPVYYILIGTPAWFLDVVLFCCVEYYGVPANNMTSRTLACHIAWITAVKVGQVISVSLL